MTLAVPIVQLATFNFPPSPGLPTIHPCPGSSGPCWKFSWVESLSQCLCKTTHCALLFPLRPQGSTKRDGYPPPWRSLCLTYHLSLRGRTHSLPIPGGEIGVKTKGFVTPTVFFILPSNVNCLDNPEVGILKILKIRFAVILKLHPGFNLEWSD